MPNNGARNDFALRILGTLLTAAVIGSWGYAITRASADDVIDVEKKIDSVEKEGVDRERRIEGQLTDIRSSIHEMDVKQAAFRAQVREALRIPENP